MAHVRKETTLESFFAEAPALNPDRSLITGVVCGVRVENVEEPTMREIRYLDKLIDELAKGKQWRRSCAAQPITDLAESGAPARQ